MKLWSGSRVISSRKSPAAALSLKAWTLSVHICVCVSELVCVCEHAVCSVCICAVCVSSLVAGAL